jgi:hypothetical protein
MKKNLITLGVLLCTLFSLVACNVNIDGQHEGLSIGFNYTGPKYYPIMSAVMSDKHVFNINDVTLDLYFGWFDWDSTNVGSGDNYHLVFYITTGETGWWIDSQQDYHNVEGQYFLTEVPEFNTKDYATIQTKSKGKEFNHSKKIMIPQEAFKHQMGILNLHAQIIKFSDEDDLYHFDCAYSNPIENWYTINNDNTVSLGK